MSSNLQNKVLFQQVAELLQNARHQVLRTVNSTMTYTYFEIGRMIVEEEQNGKDMAEYGKQLLKGLSEQLTDEFGKGFSIVNLENMRKFYLTYSISQSLTGELETPKTQTLSAQFNTFDYQILVSFFKLTWTHYVFLMRIDDEKERSFYEIESEKYNWSVRELKRQYDSALYTRLALSRDKEGILKLSEKGQIIEKPKDIILASKQTHPFLVEYFFKKALHIGKKRFPKEFLEENKEHLWAIHETRPYLMAINGLAQLNYQEGDFWGCSKKLERLIKLCPNDNLGVRELLFTVLLDLDEFKKFKKYSEMFQDDSLASTIFSNVFYSFFNDNDLEKTLYLLKVAQKSNSYITKKLINPNIKFKLNDSYALGSPEEANNYCYFAKEMWEDHKELIHWLKQN